MTGPITSGKDKGAY